MNSVDTIVEIGNRAFDKRKLSNDEKLMLLREYKRETGVSLQPNCGNCFITIVQYFTKLKTKKMEVLLYKLKAGKKIMLHGMSQVITNANLTNANAAALLKRVPAAIKYFEVFPEDWNSRVPSKASAPVAVVEPETADDLDINELRRKNLEAKTTPELRTICENLEIDADVFAKMKKSELVDLLFEKTK